MFQNENSLSFKMFSVNHECAWEAICQSWNSSEMFEEPVERAQTFLHFAAIHPHSHPFTEYTVHLHSKRKD